MIYGRGNPMCVAFFKPRKLFRLAFVVGFSFYAYASGLLPVRTLSVALITHTGFDTYYPFLNLFFDEFKRLLLFLFCGYWSARKYMFFHDVANDVFIVYIFEFFNDTCLC